MRTLCVIALLFAALPVFAAELLRVPEIGISITVPEGWKQDAGDDFGFVIRPPGDGHRVKMRIHKVSQTGMTPGEAITTSLKAINERRAKQGQNAETLESSEAVVTKSGIKGQRGVIGPGAYYIDRYYFAHPSGGMFCICVYKNPKWPEFSRECEQMILETVRAG